MTDPVMPDDEETDYLSTQAIADYLASESQVALDGILYPSVQADKNGLNLVLFHKSARCAELDIPEGTEIDGMIYCPTEDGDELAPTVWETTSPAKEEGTEKDSADPFKQGSIPRDGRGQFNHDSRKITLRIDPESVRVHQVQAVTIKTDEARVNRHRSETILDATPVLENIAKNQHKDLHENHPAPIPSPGSLTSFRYMIISGLRNLVSSN